MILRDLENKKRLRTAFNELKHAALSYFLNKLLSYFKIFLPFTMLIPFCILPMR